MPSPLDMPRVRPALSPRLHLIPHAIKRCRELGFDPAEVLACASDPDLRYESDPARYGPGEYVCKRRDVTCVVRARDLAILTVLLPTQIRWAHGRDTRLSVA